jgi:hypothetical protein
VVLVANHEGVGKFAPCARAGSGEPGALLGCVSLPDQAVATWEDPAARDGVRAEFMGWVEKVADGTLLLLPYENFAEFGESEPALARDFLFAMARVLSIRLRNTSFRLRR